MSSAPAPPSFPFYGYSVLSFLELQQAGVQGLDDSAAGASFTMAKTYCESQGGTLATVDSMASNNEIVGALQALPGGGGEAWIGGKFMSSSWSWEWLAGGGTIPLYELNTPAHFANWDEELGEPPSGGSPPGHCIALSPYSKTVNATRYGKWYAEECDTRALLYAVCQGIAPPPPSMPPALFPSDPPPPTEPPPPPSPPFHGFSVIDLDTLASVTGSSYLNWTSANELCRTRSNGNLATIASEADNDEILQIMDGMPGGAGHAWIGGAYDVSLSEAAWRWASGGGTFPSVESHPPHANGFANWDAALGEPKTNNAAWTQAQQGASATGSPVACATIDPAARSVEQRRGKWFATDCTQRVLRYAVCQEIAPPPFAPPPPPEIPWSPNLAVLPAVLVPLAAVIALVLYRRRREGLRKEQEEATRRRKRDEAEAAAAAKRRELEAEEAEGVYSFWFVPRSVVLEARPAPLHKHHLSPGARAARRSSSTASPGAGAARRFSSAATSAAKSESRKGSGKAMQRLPVFQELLRRGQVTRLPVSAKGAIAGELRQAYLAVSHRWETPQEPDTHGEQQKAIQRYLIEHPEIEWVWFDYWCMPQGAHVTPAEKVMFSWMLRRINLLYLGARVLVLQDLSYQSRFWTQFEAWLSFQTSTPEGLVPASVEARRSTIVPVHGANSIMAEGLTAMWAKRTPKEAHELLAKPDVMVTNQKDKEMQLPKILALNEEVRSLLGGGGCIDIEDQARASNAETNDTVVQIQINPNGGWRRPDRELKPPPSTDPRLDA